MRYLFILFAVIALSSTASAQCAGSSNSFGVGVPHPVRATVAAERSVFHAMPHPIRHVIAHVRARR